MVGIRRFGFGGWSWIGQWLGTRVRGHFAVSRCRLAARRFGLFAQPNSLARGRGFRKEALEKPRIFVADECLQLRRDLPGRCAGEHAAFLLDDDACFASRHRTVARAIPTEAIELFGDSWWKGCFTKLGRKCSKRVTASEKSAEADC